VSSAVNEVSVSDEATLRWSLASARLTGSTAGGIEMSVKRMASLRVPGLKARARERFP
jgi:hypothetical protein